MQKPNVINKMCLPHRDLSGCGCWQRWHCGEKQPEEGNSMSLGKNSILVSFKWWFNLNTVNKNTKLYLNVTVHAFQLAVLKGLFFCTDMNKTQPKVKFCLNKQHLQPKCVKKRISLLNSFLKTSVKTLHYK